MKNNILFKSASALLVVALFSSSAHSAGVPVIDPTAIAQAVSQVKTKFSKLNSWTVKLEPLPIMVIMVICSIIQLSVKS